MRRSPMSEIGPRGQRDAAYGELPDGLAQLVDAGPELKIEIDGKHAASGR